jgi:hypothetical protein
MSYKRFMAVFDIHGDQSDPDAMKAMFEFKESVWKPHEVINGGDNWNFAALRKGASEDEREASIQQDYNSGMEIMKRLRPTYFLRGNHDERLWDLAAHGKGVLRDFAIMGINEISNEIKKLGCLMLPYDVRDGVLRYAKNLSIAHGYKHNEHSAKSMAGSFGNIIYGHVHAFSSCRFDSLDERIGQAVGCLCSLDMDFERSRTAKLKKEHGWVYGVKNTKTGNAHYWLARKFDGRWLLPTDYVTL